MRLISNLLSLLIAVGVIWFSIANRHAVTLTLDPIPLSFTAPLYLPVLLAALLGLIAGGFVSWRHGGSRRAQLRQAERQRDTLQRNLDKAEAEDRVTPSSDADRRREIAER